MHMSNSSSTRSNGIGVLGLLGVAFVVLKLCHVIDWSWWWVTVPFWGGLAVAIAILLGLALIWLFAAISSARRRKRVRLPQR